jgi:ABC-2 type transport system permease protein
MSTGFLAVAAREVHWLLRDRVARLIVIMLPLLAFGLLSATFRNAVVRDLGVDIVDQDRSRTSALFVQAVDAAPNVRVVARSGDLNAAMHAIRSGETIAAVYVPRDFERDLLAQKRPQIVIFHNKQFYTPGNIASSALQSALNAAGADVALVAAPAASPAPGKLVVESYVLTNPALNYIQFLLRAILPTVLHVIVAIAAGYAVGSEFSRKREDDWIETAGGSTFAALAGKLAPYLLIFAVQMTLGSAIIHGYFEIPFRGDSGLLGLAALLMLSAYLALGAMLQLLVRNLAVGLSLVGLICSPAFGFAGLGFPLLAMNGFARAWGALLPLRWYVQVLVDQAARGIPVAASVPPLLALAGLASGFFALGLLLMRKRSRDGLVKPPVPAAPDPEGRGLTGAFTGEIRRVLGDSGAFGLIVMAPVIYAALYPQPYIGQLIRKVPMAVVDADNSDVSRRLVLELDAGEATRVASRPATLAEARAALDRREVFGIVGIPQGTERELLKGNPARVSAHVDAAYFLLYNRTAQGFAEAAGKVSADLAGGGARSDGSLARASLNRVAPVEILNQPLFNPTGGYGSYIVPAAFILILQQTLLMGVATLGGVAHEQGGRGAISRRGGPVAVIGQGLAHLTLSIPAYLLALVLLPRLYGFSYSSHILDLAVFAIPFILSISFLGQFIGACLRHRETAVLLLIALGLPLFFLVGIAWPPEAIPPFLQRLSLAIPSTNGISGLVRLDQMGADFADVAPAWRRLWLLAGIYAVLAMLAGQVFSRERRT